MNQYALIINIRINGKMTEHLQAIGNLGPMCAMGARLQTMGGCCSHDIRKVCPI